MKARPVRIVPAATAPEIELGALRQSIGFFVFRAARTLSHDWASPQPG